MTRTYTLKKRAEQQAETRQRIVDAAVEMHSTVGPLATLVLRMGAVDRTTACRRWARCDEVSRSEARSWGSPHTGTNRMGRGPF